MTNKHKISLILAITLLFLMGGWLRFDRIGSQSYWMDEGYTVNAVDSGLRNGFTYGAAILDSGFTYACPLYCLPTAGIVAWLGTDPASYRLLSGLFGVIGIGVAGWLAWIVTKKLPATILSVFVVSLSYWQIAWSRQARWYTMLEVFFWLALGCFYVFLNAPTRNRKILSLSLSLVFTILAVLTHSLAYLLPVIMFAWYVIEKRPRIKHIAIAVGCVLFVLAVFEWGVGKHFIGNSLHKVHMYYTLPYYLNFYLRNYWPFLLLIVYGYFQAIPETKKKILFLTLPFLSYLFCLSFFTNIVHYRYLFHTTLGLLVASAAIAGGLLEQQGSKKRIFIAAWLFLFSLFLFGQVIVTSPQIYQLESDDPSAMNRPYYAYTPQPDFNAAYAFIGKEKKADDIIISSHPHFNKIYLNEAGYWLKYNYLGMDDAMVKQIVDDKEYYVGATVIDNLSELQTIMKTHHGFIFFDYMSTDGRISPEIFEYIREHATRVFSNDTEPYTVSNSPPTVFSLFWVYRF